jgi:hypothetical protein
MRDHLRVLSGKYPAISNISRTVRVALMYLVSQSDEALLRIREQSLSRGASQSAVRRRWLSLCTVWPSHSQNSSLSTAILALEKVRSDREPNLGCRGASRPGLCDVLPKKSLHESCRMGRRIVVMKLICSLDHCECEGHTLHKLSQRCLTADWLAPREGYFPRMHSKVSPVWLARYIKATRPVLEIFKMAGYLPDRPRTRPPKTPNNGQNYCFLYFNLCFSRQEKGEEVFWTEWQQSFWI